MLRVIIIDDAPEKVKRFRELFEDYHEINPQMIDAVASVEEAESKLSYTQYDLAILDLYLPLRHGDDPNPENAIQLLKDLSSDDDLMLPYNIVGITRWKNADPKYKEIFDNLLLAYIIYEQENDNWKNKLRHKIEFLLKSQRSVQEQDFCNYDVAIINALKSENIKVQEAFGLDGWKEETIPADLSTTFYTKSVKLASGKSIRIVTCYALQMASTASSALTTKLIYNYRPRYLFMTGIAAAVNREDANLGDILVASKVWDGASGKIKTDEGGNDIFMPDYHELPLDSDMQGIVNRLASDRNLLNSIEEAYRFQQGKPNTKLNVHIGPIASVPAVLSSKEEVAKIQKHCRKLLGIEMEGYGVFYAANNSARPRPTYTVLIKSVSDYADPDKSDNYRDYAMYTSAAFVYHIIMGHLPYENNSSIEE